MKERVTVLKPFPLGCGSGGWGGGSVKLPPSD